MARFEGDITSVKVEGDTPEEEFEEVAERAYNKISKGALDRISTETELIDLLDREWGKGRAGPKLLYNLPRVFKKKGWFVEHKVEVAFPEQEVIGVQEEPIKVETQQPAKQKKAKWRKPEVSSAGYDEEYIISYVDSRPSRVKRGKIYKVTRSGKSVTKRSYISRMRNLMKRWKRKEPKS
jgi:hypothetical protein